MRNVLILPFHLYVKAQDAAANQGITLIELCQRACVCKLDSVLAAKPEVKQKQLPTQSPGTGLEA